MGGAGLSRSYDLFVVLVHTGTWETRARMINRAFYAGLVLTFGGAIGVFFGLDTGAVMATGASLTSLTLATHVGGKVAHDKFHRDET